MTNSSTVNPSEVGWQFVPQYYTFVNKNPNRLHCFYTKASTFIHGTEGEDGKPCFGQQEIHDKITSIGFQDCKVFIHSVDAQSSANGGIIIQVIGEMSNKGEAWRKFVQTFFLAEQPNGYFVLNDIFRFLKEESVEEGEDQELEAAPRPASPAAPPPVLVSPAPHPPAELGPISEPTSVVSSPPAEERALSPALSPAPTPSPPPHVNGDGPDVKFESVDEIAVSREPTPAPPPEPASLSPAPVSPASLPPQSFSPAPAATPSPAPPPPQALPPQHAAPAVAPAAPSAAAPSGPKTWASLAATGAKGWGSQVAVQSRGTSETPAVPPPGPRVASRPLAQGPVPQGVAPLNVTTPQCFVKGVTENVSDVMLRSALERFGPVKEVDIIRSKACAFVEFVSLDAAKSAIGASLPLSQGGEGGVRIETDDGAGQARIYVETRKERGERPLARGPPMNGDRGRGGFRGRGGPGPQRGRRGGN